MQEKWKHFEKRYPEKRQLAAIQKEEWQKKSQRTSVLMDEAGKSIRALHLKEASVGFGCCREGFCGDGMIHIVRAAVDFVDGIENAPY